MLADPSEEELKNQNVSTDDHPLNSSPSSKWAEYFADNSILEQIDKDVRRTLPDFAFFQLPVPYSHLSPLSPKLEAINRAQSPSILETLDIDDSTSMSTYSDSMLTTPSELDAEVAALEAQLAIISQPSLQSVNQSLNRNMYSPKSTSFDLFDNKLSSLPLQPEVIPIPTRRSIFKRVQHLNKEFGARGNSRPGSPALSCKSDGSIIRDDDSEVDLHWEAIERILFIYAKLNPGVGYVQGMNEILGPIYYTMANDSDEEGKGI